MTAGSLPDEADLASLDLRIETLMNAFGERPDVILVREGLRVRDPVRKRPDVVLTREGLRVSDPVRERPHVILTSEGLGVSNPAGECSVVKVIL